VHLPRGSTADPERLPTGDVRAQCVDSRKGRCVRGASARSARVAGRDEMNNAAMDPVAAYGEFDRIRGLLGERISDENVRQIGERSDGAVDALERISSIARGLGVDVGATTTKPGTKAEARKSEAPKAPKPTTEQAPAAYQPVKRERREFFQVSNKFFDWQ